MVLLGHNQLSKYIENTDEVLGKACFPWKTRFGAISSVKAKEIYLPWSNEVTLHFSE